MKGETSVIDSFFTIEKEVETEIIEKKSKFIAKIVNVCSEEEANEKLEEIRKMHKDARHNVFAYRLAAGIERFSDDGEPSGTAGVPILGILRGEKLENVLVVVTRYFGGILLGTGGLVRAYSSVVKEAILASKKISMKLCCEYEIVVDYSYYDILNHYFQKHKIQVKNVQYGHNICMNIIAPKALEEQIITELEGITNRTISIKVKDTTYHT